MKIKFKVTIAFVLFISISIAQDCNCKHWKKTSYDNSGHVSYEYSHSCYQPGTAYEYLGYDQAYCDQLVEDEKRRLLNIKLTQEAIEISKNTKKQELKDGYDVIEWYGKFLGNTGKWDNVGLPRFGIKGDSMFVQWNRNGGIEIRGKIKNEQLEGLLEFYEDGNEYLDPVSLFKFIRQYLKIETTWNWKPDNIYFNDIEKFESEENSKRIGIEKTFYGIYYSKTNGQKKYFSHHYIKDGILTLFTTPIDEKNACIIHNKIIVIESKKELKLFKDAYIDLKNKIEKFPTLSSNQILNKPFNEFETNLIGTWDFKSKYTPTNSTNRNEYVYILDNIIFNKDRTYFYNGKINLVFISNSGFSNPFTFLYSSNNGFWEVKDDRILLYSSKDTISNKLINLALIRVNDKLKIIDQIDENNINANINFLKMKKSIVFSKDNIIMQNMSLIMTLLEDEILKNNDYLTILNSAIFPSSEFDVVNKKNEIRFDKLTAKKAIIKNVDFKETLLLKFYNQMDKESKFEQYGYLNFTLKGKKVKP